MGSNPISPTIILDTSPLQALYRAGVLPVLRNVFDRILMPRAVYDETVASLPLAVPGRVPDLTDFPWIEVSEVPDTELAEAGAALVGKRRASELYRWFNRQIDRPEVEAIILAKRHGSPVVIEDNNGVKCALDFGVAVVNVADLLVEMERRHQIPDARACAAAILATGYYSKELRWLSWRRSQPGAP